MCKISDCLAGQFTKSLIFQKFGTKSGKPTEKIVIASCGELVQAEKGKDDTSLYSQVHANH